MDFNAAVAEVLDIIKRPEKLNTIKRELNAACTFFSMDSNFRRDFVEQLTAIDTQEYTQAIALSEFDRYRKFHYIKRAGTKDFLNVISEKELFDKNCDNWDTYYVAGSNLNIKTRVLASNLDVGFFQYPVLMTGATGEDIYWMLEVSPYMLIDRAAAAVWRQIGQDKDFKSYSESAKDLYLAFRKDQEIMSL